MSGPAAFWEAVEMFNAAECDELLAALRGILPAVRDIGSSPLQVTPIPPEPFRKWYDRVYASVAQANDRAWRYKLDGWLSLQSLVYPPGTEYPWHTDQPDPRARGRVFKLALSLLLSRPDDFTGGELELMIGSTTTTGPAFIAPLRRRGSGVVFPSFLVHRIRPVTTGTRVVLVARLGGPPFS